MTYFSRIFCAAFLVATAAAKPSALSQAAYVIQDNTTGFILESSGPNKKLQVGSLTKVATAMVVIDWAEARNEDLGQMATVPQSAQALSAGGGVGFRPGDKCSLRDLLYAAMMQSDNQAAETLAHHIGSALHAGGETTPVTYFVAQMNALARRLGMNRTRFLNPHGLDTTERSAPYSTAEDLAQLTKYAMSNSAFRFYVSQKERRITLLVEGNDPSQYLLRNTNELLGVKSIDGVKTGTTRKAGPCLILSAARAPESRKEGDSHIITPRRLNLIVLGAPKRFATAEELLTKGWQLYDAWAAANRPMRGWKPPQPATR